MTEDEHNWQFVKYVQDLESDIYKATFICACGTFNYVVVDKFIGTDNDS